VFGESVVSVSAVSAPWNASFTSHAATFSTYVATTQPPCSRAATTRAIDSTQMIVRARRPTVEPTPIGRVSPAGRPAAPCTGGRRGGGTAQPMPSTASSCPFRHVARTRYTTVIQSRLPRTRQSSPPLVFSAR